jgi:hypothetical protein
MSTLWKYSRPQSRVAVAHRNFATRLTSLPPTFYRAVNQGVDGVGFWMA